MHLALLHKPLWNNIIKNICGHYVTPMICTLWSQPECCIVWTVIAGSQPEAGF